MSQQETVTAQIDGSLHWVPVLGVNATYCEKPLKHGMILIGHPSSETNENWCERCAVGIKDPTRPAPALL